MVVSVATTTSWPPLLSESIPDCLHCQLAFNSLALLLIVVVFLRFSMDLYSMAISSAPNAYFSDLWSYDNESSGDLYDDFPPSEEPVWVLGIKYSSLHELDEIRSDIKSRLWITYRKNFVPIGEGNGQTSDSGWGCMLRCGQMALAQALCLRHLGRNWRWTQSQSLEEDLQYREVLRLFEDKKTCIYSLHQIASMGANEGKPVGTWFGPNTIAQVLKKLSAFDKWNNIVIHVAMDNMVVIDEIKNSCRIPQTTAENEDPETENNTNKSWKPLVLFIPLRLGLSEINPIYFKSLKTTFKMKQTLGIIGGRPNHALYFIGCVANQLVYLDPHTNQPFVDLDEPDADDSSYHCSRASRMDISHLDPSIALCFYCDTEEEFDNWCHLVFTLLVSREKQSLFELTKERPPHWPQYEEQFDSSECVSSYSTVNSVSTEPFTELEDREGDSDDEFELLG